MWFTVPTVEATLAGAPSVILLSTLNAAALALWPFTVVRTRGVLQMVSDQSGVTQTYGVALGYAVVSDQAVAIGVTAVPTPVTDKDSDLWFVYEQLFGQFSFASAVGRDASAGFSKDYDSRAMRKVEDGQDIAIVAENEINGTIVINSARMLVKLH